MNWIALAVVTAAFYALYNIFIKQASAHLQEVLGAVILQAVALLLGCGWLIYLKMTGVPLEVTSRGVGLSVVAGVFVGLAEICSFLVFARGVPASAGVPVIIGGSVLIAAVIGIVWLRESLGIYQILGLVLIVGGIWLLSAKAAP
jgi:transporter family protein